ncbi:MAG: hypothetical protein OEZ01_01945 [Candidatus Heimdallarchaeota archaeon]|nr:hypothetical protein [Candidatus Heimdallarchaeota archaeon]MDH5644736.1 hypothetical protein [Candidatus Heimdallarchaeota archaeon]
MQTQLEVLSSVKLDNHALLHFNLTFSQLGTYQIIIDAETFTGIVFSSIVFNFMVSPPNNGTPSSDPRSNSNSNSNSSNSSDSNPNSNSFLPTAPLTDPDEDSLVIVIISLSFLTMAVGVTVYRRRMNRTVGKAQTPPENLDA